MSSAKRGGGADPIYQTHLFGSGPFAVNAAVNREAAIVAMLQRVLGELAVNRFKWSGFPESVDVRFIEMSLFYNALAVCYWDKDYERLLVVRGSGMGYVNMLDNPVSFTVIGPGSTTQPTNAGASEVAPAQFGSKILSSYDPVRHGQLESDAAKLKAIPIWANYFRSPDIDIVSIYAKRLAILDRTIEINSKNARRNKILKSTPNMQLSAVNVARSIDQGDELIQITGPLQDMEFIEAIDLGITPDSYEKLSLLRTRIWNEAVGLLGIDGANQDKKERLVAAEVSANDQQAASIRFVNLQARKQAAEHINKVFGLNVTVEYNVEVEEMAEKIFAAELEIAVNNAGSDDETEDESTDEKKDEE